MASQKYKNIQSLQIEKKISILDELSLYFLRVRDNLFSLGVSSNLDSNEIKRIILLNKLTFVALFCISTLSIFFLFINFKTTSYFLLSQCFLLSSVYIFHYFQRINQAKIVYLLACNLIIFCLTSTFSMESGILFFYIPIILQTGLLFNENEKNIQVGGIFISIICIIFLEATDYSLMSVNSITNDLIHYLNIYSLLTISILSFYLITLIVQIRGSSDSMIRENEKLQKYLVKEIINRQSAFESLDFSVKMQNELMDNIQSGIVIINDNGDIIKSNKLFEDMFNFNLVHSTKNIFTSLPNIYKSCGNYIEEIKENILMVQNGNTEYRELEFARKTRFSKEYFSLKISRIGIANSSTQGIFLMHNNISELKKSKERLEYFRNFNINLKTRLPDIMLNISSEGKILDFHSEQSSSMYISSESMLGKNISEFGLPDEFLIEFNQTFKQVLESGNSHKIQYNFKFDTIDYSYSATLLLSDTKEVMILVKKLDEKDNNFVI
jgi:PAS domain-containing protein